MNITKNLLLILSLIFTDIQNCCAIGNWSETCAHEKLYLHPEVPVSRIKASLLAAAAGDCMGAPTEFLKTMEAIKQAFPTGIHTLKDTKRTVQKDGKTVVPYTDDTRMAKLVMQQLIKIRSWAQQEGAKKGLNAIDYIKHHKKIVIHRMMTSIALSFIEDLKDKTWGWAAKQRAPGMSCLTSVNYLDSVARRTCYSHKLSDYPQNWWHMDNNAGGCGSVMHAYPFGLVFYDDPELAAELAAKHSYITHAEPFAVSACASMAMGVALAVQGKDESVIADGMLATARHYDSKEGCHEKTADKIERALTLGSDQSATPARVFGPGELDGWTAHTAVGAVIYILNKHPNDLAQALYMGVHNPGDSDSIASLAGALIGARTGMQQIPENWVYEIEDGHQLADMADQIDSSQAQ